MNDAHLHLLVNHLPVFSVFFGLAALLWAVIRNSSEMRWASILLFVVAGVSVWIAVETGEGAEDLVETLPGVTEALIHEHEEAGEFASILVTVLAVGSIGMGAIGRAKPQALKAAQAIVLLLAAASSAALARTAFLGGEIRHTEIRADAVLSPTEEEH